MNFIISQSLATGLPVITTKHSGLPEQVIDGFNGFLVNEGDYQQLAEKIIYMIENNHVWMDLSQHAREHVQKNYNLKEQIRKQLNLYEKIIQRR